MLKKITYVLVGCLLIFMLVACSSEGDEADQTTTDSTETTSEEEVTVSDDELVEEDMVVAVVNDQALTGHAYNTVYTQTKTLLYEQGQDVDDQEMVKEQALNALVSQEVLSQDASNKGIDITEADIDAYVNETKDQFNSEEAFETELESLNYTLESFRSQVALQLEQEAYIEQEFDDIEVSDQEIEDYYNQLSEQSDEIPSLDEVRDSIEAQLANNQLQNLLNERIQELKDDADVETMI